MIRGLNLILFVLAGVALISVYGLKYSSESIAEEKAEIQRAIAQQKAQLSLLEADWAYLTQPSHIEPIIIRHAEVLSLEPVRADQFGAIEDIPMRPEIVDDAALSELLTALDAGIDPIGDKLEELFAQ